jgi:pimeloyl-ACP methyl ester carboxylesterase
MEPHKVTANISGTRTVHAVSDPSTPPVLLVHGWGGAFDSTWRRSGFTELLADAGREVIGVDLLGHGTAPKPHDPDAYLDLTDRLIDALPEEPVDVVAFSMGALTTLRLATKAPERFRRIVTGGIGRNVFERDPEQLAKIVDAIEGRGDPEDNVARLFAQYAHQPGNDPVALAAVMRRSGQPFTPEELATVTCPVLVVIGDRDFAGPAEPLVAALPDARGVTLRNVDHFATPESFGFIDAALEFLDAVPT